MPEVISTLVAQSGLPSGGRVFSDYLKLAVLPNRNVLQLRLGARSVKTVASLRIAGRSMPVAMNSWSGDDPVFCRIAPDLWLLQSAIHEAGDLEEAARAGCGKRSFAVTNISDACATLVIEGSLATSLLARGCGLDLSAGRLWHASVLANPARTTPRRASPRELRAVRVPGRSLRGAVSLRLDRGRRSRTRVSHDVHTSV